jgi:hypothetical protein
MSRLRALDVWAARAQLRTTADRFLDAITLADREGAACEGAVLVKLVMEVEEASERDKRIRPVFHRIAVGPGSKSWDAFLQEATPWERAAVLKAVSAQDHLT